jgi:endoribonuclease Nob1
LTVLVLDTSAFIMGFNPSKAQDAYSVRAVEKELSEGTMPQLRFRMFSEKGDLIVRTASPRGERLVEEASSLAGESGYLSDADREVLALAMDLKLEGKEPVVVSDDYAIQNLADHLRISHSSLANFGIVHRFDWIMYCPACFRRYRPPEKKCRVCGTELKRKVLSKSRANRR